MVELLTPEQMAHADRLAIGGDPDRGLALMLNAGRAVYRHAISRFPGAVRWHVLAGPGNNGGDGYVVAKLLRESGADVILYALAQPKPGSDARRALEQCPVEPVSIDRFNPKSWDVVIDALFGAGLDRPLDGPVCELIARTRNAGCAVVAVDLPSGLSGKTGQELGDAFQAALTVTFFRKKPGHLLYPGRALCGEVAVADIGIPDRVLFDVKADCFENTPELWRDRLPLHDWKTHKYSRGAVAVFSGGPSSTGAARLAAMAAARAGAGAVTVLSPPSSLTVNAAHLTSTMVRSIAGESELDKFLASGRTRSLVIGPGFGNGERLRRFVLRSLDPQYAHPRGGLLAVIVDADSLTEFADARAELFDAIASTPCAVVMTPHGGEFACLFPDIAESDSDKLSMSRAAAKRSGAIVLYKGADSVIAAPDSTAAINANASPVLATAGAGDVLSGLVASLAAQQMPAWESACAACWLHAEAGNDAGLGAIAEDIAQGLPRQLHRLIGN